MGGNVMKMNQKGFTLIELLIVIAIIAILAAIAIPQFAQYRVRGYNASANTDIRNIRTSQESLYADWQRYGNSYLAALPGTGAVLAPGAGVITGPGTAAAPPILTLTDAVVQPRGLQVALGNNVQLDAGTDATWTSYTMSTKHFSGDTVYGADNDSTANYRQTNSTWVSGTMGAGGVADRPASVAGAVDLIAPWLAM
jgi:prepilin-type N-terminal cleavage/methylation domain-containing protein